MWHLSTPTWFLASRFPLRSTIYPSSRNDAYSRPAYLKITLRKKNSTHIQQARRLFDVRLYWARVYCDKNVPMRLLAFILNIPRFDEREPCWIRRIGFLWIVIVCNREDAWMHLPPNDVYTVQYTRTYSSLGHMWVYSVRDVFELFKQEWIGAPKQRVVVCSSKK